MNDEIKRAAEKYIENTQINFEFSIMGESVEVPELFKNWCIEGIKHGYIQGSNYATEKCQEEIKRLDSLAQQRFDACCEFRDEIKALKDDLKQMCYCVKLFAPELRGKDAEEIMRKYNL